MFDKVQPPSIKLYRRASLSRVQRIVFLLAAGLGTTLLAAAQATQYTADRKTNLQAGAYYQISPYPDYGTEAFKGYGAYATYDFFHHVGVEFNFHQLNGPNSGIYERTYEIGGRYTKYFGRIGPYARVSYGRGVFNYPNSVANLAYNLFSVGGGVDFRLQKHINLRGDAEFQDWQHFLGGINNDGLTPTVVSIGAAYHF